MAAIAPPSGVDFFSARQTPAGGDPPTGCEREEERNTSRPHKDAAARADRLRLPSGAANRLLFMDLEIPVGKPERGAF